MRCPFCSNEDTQVKDSRPTEDNTSIRRRQFLWDETSKLVDFDLLGKSIKEVNLEELIDVYPKMLKGETAGRYIVNLNK